MEGYSESTEPIDAVNILPLARFEPTTSATPPSIYIYIYQSSSISALPQHPI